jgi:hypothetical protein
LVFDATALAAMFNSYPPLWALLQRADLGMVRLGFPALAIVEAGTMIGASASAWHPFLFISSISVLPLGQAPAIEIGSWSGTLGARHALWEARYIDCPLITRRPELYASDEAHIQAI